MDMLTFIMASVSCVVTAVLLRQRKHLLIENAGLRAFRSGEGAFSYGDLIWPGGAKVVEEAGEVVQVFGKLMMVHGHNEAHWQGDLIDKIEEEIPDLQAALEVFRELNEGRLDVGKMNDRFIAKKELFHKWNFERLFERVVK